MESQDHLSPSHVDASRPSLGFPLGTALLLIIIFSLSGILSCCYHWDKLRSLRQSFSDSDPQIDSPNKPKTHSTVSITILITHCFYTNCNITQYGGDSLNPTKRIFYLDSIALQPLFLL